MSSALIYCRVSTRGQEQDGTSLDSQEAACIAHAQALGHTIGRITREVYSGAELWDRPLLSRDRADLKHGVFQALICYATDRLSRNPIHLALIAEECERIGAALHFVSEPLDSSPEGQLIQYVRGYAGQVEREKIRERQLRGKRQRALNGKLFNMGPELYGYRRDKDAGVRHMFESEATIVQTIYHWIVDEHLGVRTVAARLNENGVPPPSAGKMVYPDPTRRPRWGRSQIAKLVANPAYKGETIAWRTQRPATIRDRSRADFDPSQGRIIRPESEWIKLPDGTTPAIVAPDVWQAAQDALRDRKATYQSRNLTRPYLLRGLVWCGKCGKRMYSSADV